MTLKDLFERLGGVATVPDVAKHLGVPQASVRQWAEANRVPRCGNNYAFMLDHAEKAATMMQVVAPMPIHILPAHTTLRRVTYSVAEAATMIGVKADALRRTIERHSVDEGEELVAHLNHGLVARRRKNFGRWSVHVPHALNS